MPWLLSSSTAGQFYVAFLLKLQGKKYTDIFLYHQAVIKSLLSCNTAIGNIDNTSPDANGLFL